MIRHAPAFGVRSVQALRRATVEPEYDSTGRDAIPCLLDRVITAWGQAEVVTVLGT